MIESENTEHISGRADVLIDRATRVVRLLAWLAMFALCCLMLWVVSGMAARAGDPKAAARELGQAANTAAGAIARNAGSTATVPGYAGTNVPERSLTASGYGGRGAGAPRRSARSRRQCRPRGDRGGDDAARPAGGGKRPGGRAGGDDRGQSAERRARRGRPRLRDRVRVRVGPAGCRDRRLLRAGQVLRRRRLRDRAPKIQYRVRRGHHPAQHGAGARRRGVRPRGHALLQGQAAGLPYLFRGPGQLLQELRACWSASPTARRPETIELAEERNAGNTHYLGKYCSKRTFFGICIRRSRAWCVFGSKLGRILQEQGRSQLGVGWGNCRGLHGRRDRGHRLRQPRPLRVHGKPDGRVDGTVGVAARCRGHRRGHAHPHPRLLQPGPVMARAVLRALKRVLAATIVWAVMGAPAAAAEWRSWCHSGLGWHFYCDRQEETRQTPPASAPPPQASGASATERILEMRRALEEARAAAILDPSTENVTAYLRLQQETLAKAATFSDAFRRTVWATPELDYTLKRPVGALAKRLWSDERRAEVAGALATLRRALRADLSRPPGLRRVPGVRPAAARLRDPPRPRRAGGVADRRTARRLARGGPRQRARPERLGLAGTPVPAVVLYDTKTKKCAAGRLSA